jgi:hypothetical protein
VAKAKARRWGRHRSRHYCGTNRRAGLPLSGHGFHFFAAPPLGRFDPASAPFLQIEGKTPQNAS